MAIGANSYGSAAHVAKLVPQHAGESLTFSGTTNPTISTVETELDFVSSIMNSILAAEGFDIPISQSDGAEMLAGFANRMVAEVVKAIRGGGRFGPLIKEGRKSLNSFMISDIREFIESIADGLENLGASRSKGTVDSLSFRDENDGGQEIAPLFQREAFGNVVDNWDT